MFGRSALLLVAAVALPATAAPTVHYSVAFNQPNGLPANVDKIIANAGGTIAERLPEKASRELAFGLAASVAWADGRTPASELRFLKALQQTFELADEDVARLFELAECNAPLPPTESR